MKSKWILTSALVAALSLAAPTGAQTPTANDRADSTATTATKKAVAVALPTDQQIADAKANGMVWVNTRTKVYHQADSGFYGKTKHGKFMTKDEATKAGFRAAKESATKKGHKSATGATEVH
jgi:hypothetical protein